MYDMQITLYDANLCYFMDEFIIYVIIQHTKSLSIFIFFALNLKIRMILRSTIPLTSHDPTYDPNLNNLDMYNNMI